VQDFVCKIAVTKAILVHGENWIRCFPCVFKNATPDQVDIFPNVHMFNMSFFLRRLLDEVTRLTRQKMS
jgi:hypothetical protein